MLFVYFVYVDDSILSFGFVFWVYIFFVIFYFLIFFGFLGFGCFFIFFVFLCVVGFIYFGWFWFFFCICVFLKGVYFILFYKFMKKIICFRFFYCFEIDFISVNFWWGKLINFLVFVVYCIDVCILLVGWSIGSICIFIFLFGLVLYKSILLLIELFLSLF